MTKTSVSPDIRVDANEAMTLMFHHITMAIAFFEAGPADFADTIKEFNKRYPDIDLIGNKATRTFLENLNAEYVDEFDERAAEDENKE